MVTVFLKGTEQNILVNGGNSLVVFHSYGYIKDINQVVGTILVLNIIREL